MRALQAAAKRPLLASLPAFAVGTIASCLVGLACWSVTAQLIEKDMRERFAYHSRNAQQTISARVKSYTDLLRASASVFQTSYPLTRAQFHQYVTGLHLSEHFPAIDTINFARYVRRSDLAAFVREQSAELKRERGIDFKIVPPSDFDDKCVIVYIAGPNVNPGAFGIDILANVRVRQAMLDSRDTGILIASGLPIRHMSGPNKTGLGMRLPVYRPGVPLDTVEQRRFAYIGSIGLAFSVDLLVRGVLEEMAIKHVRMTLTDTGIATNGPTQQRHSPPGLLYDSAGNATQPGPPQPSADGSFVEVLPVNFNGRMWHATFSTPKSNLSSGFNEYLPWLALAAGFVSSLLLWAVLHMLASSRRRAMRLAEEMTAELRESQIELQQSHENLRRLAAHAEQIKERERKRIAREIHDDLGQNLLALRIEADLLASRTGERHPHLHSRAVSTVSQIDTTIRSVRQIINDLRPHVLDLGLSAAVEWQIDEFRRRTGIACHLLENETDIHVSDHCATAFFRILQESLNNIVRHARATKVNVELLLLPGALTMTVVDNGVGFNQRNHHKSGSFGLVGIEERVKLLNGTCTIISTPGTGTTVRVSVPFPHEAAPPVAPGPVPQGEPEGVR